MDLSIGITWSNFVYHFIFFTFPLVFLNSKLIYFILKRLRSLKGKVFEVLRFQNLNERFEERINIISFFPTRALLLEIGFILSKFIGFYYLLKYFLCE